MTAVVHVFQSAAPKSGKEVQALIDGGALEDVPGSPRLPPFIEALRSRYPDAHTLEASGGSGDESVWADSPLQADPSSALVTLGLLDSNADAAFWPFVVHCAADHGLHVYDPSSGTVWRADRRIVDFEGREEDFPPRPDTSAAPSRPKRFPLSSEAVLDRIFTGLEPRVSARGWRFHRERGWHDSHARRQQGAVSQVIQIYASSDRDEVCSIGVRIGFAEPAIGALLRELLPEDAPRQDLVKHNLQGGYTDMSAYIHEIFGALAKPITPDVFAHVRDPGELDAWIERFGAWLSGPAGTILDATGDLRALARLMLSEQRRGRISIVTGAEVLAMLALAHLAKNPAIDFDTWAAVAMDQLDRNYGSALRNSREMPHRAHQWKSETDMARHIELLIERLRGRRPGLTLAPLE